MRRMLFVLSSVGLDWAPGVQQPLCDQKVIGLNPGATAPVNFNLFTMVPKAARISGPCVASQSRVRSARGLPPPRQYSPNASWPAATAPRTIA